MHFNKPNLLSSYHSVLSSTDKFSPNVCSSWEWNSLLQKMGRTTLPFFWKLRSHLTFFPQCLISPLFNRDGV